MLVRLLASKTQRISGNNHDVDVLYLRQEPKSFFYLNDVVAKVKVLQLLEVRVSVYQLSMELNKLVSAQI